MFPLVGIFVTVARKPRNGRHASEVELAILPPMKIRHLYGQMLHRRPHLIEIPVTVDLALRVSFGERIVDL